MHQTTNSILMIRPAAFGFNEQTAESNAFQSTDTKNRTAEEINEQATAEFDTMSNKLKAHGIDVIVVQDTEEPHTPDSIFPNNWVAFHEDGSVFMFPMEAPNRRHERNAQIFSLLENILDFDIKTLTDFSFYEDQHKFMEGTGSVVWDRTNNTAYACLSTRTDADVLDEYVQAVNGKSVVFHATDADDKPIYHTNVVMCVAETFAVICLATIKDDTERKKVIQALEDSGHEILTISMDQLNAYAGNMLQVKDDKGQNQLVMSQQAYDALLPIQIEAIEKHCPIIPVAIPTIEYFGGGSARCMMAEIFLPKKITI